MRQQVRVKEQQRQRQHARRRSKQPPRRDKARQRQPQRQKNHRQARQKDHARRVPVILPQQQLGKLVPAFGALPTGVIGGQPDRRQRQQGQRAQPVHQRRMLQAEARIAGAQQRQPARDVVLLVHRRAVPHGAVQGQVEKKEHGRAHDPAFR